MPYRRLPNTDSARLKALKNAIAISMRTNHYDLAFSQQFLLRAKSFLPRYEQAVLRQKQAFKNQVDRGKQYTELSKKARIYISHFFQVMNLMIIRNELPEEARSFFKMNKKSKISPSLTTEADLLEWGKTLLEGDMERQRSGGKMIMNPTAAIVRVHYEKFRQAYFSQKDLQRINNQALQKIAEFREEANEIILHIWNEVEANFDNLDEEAKREKCQTYGLVYVYRPSEKKKKMAEKLAQSRIKRLDAQEEKMKNTSPESSTDLTSQLALFSNNQKS